VSVAQGLLQFALFFALLVAAMPLLGGYMARVFDRADPARSQTWKQYARSLIVFSGVSWLGLYLLLRTQHSGAWDLTFNTTSSFVTNTNWQYYAGETTMSWFSQMAGLAVQNFLSAAVGIVVAIVLIRGISGRALGNFWVDLSRAVLYVLLPISVVGGVLLVSQGVPQTLSHGLGPIASQEIIKELGTNGGGIFNTNSAMPFENPTAFSNLVEMFAILVIPVSLTWTYGRMVGSRRQGLAIFSAMAVVFVAGVVVCYLAERHGTPAQQVAGLHGPNLEGKEQRFGIAGSSLFAVVTTVTSCGAVNAAMESLTGIGGLVPFANMSMSETIFGGVGTGLYSMLLFALLAVFIGGLMVGRTPEYLGKKIEAREIKLIVLGTLLTPLVALFTAALAIATRYGRASIFASGPQGFSETLYAYLSQANNNGSAFAGYSGTTFADLLGGLSMVFARFAPILVVLAVAGGLVSKKVAPAGLGTLRTDTPTFVTLLVGVVVIVGALTFFPALLLGPVVQGMTHQLF
jgi:K+-transporting ATPase ATPase A chain